MKTNPGSARPHGLASREQQAAAQRSRGTYRRQLTAARPGAPTIGLEARRAAALILEVLAGVRTPVSAATALGIRLPRYYVLEQRAIQGLISACEPRPVGRTVSTDRRLARLERELALSRRELARNQALARTTQRALGLAPASSPASTAAGKAQEASSGTKRRRRKPCVRALRAVRLLQSADSPGKEGPAAVQGAVGSSPAPGSADGGARPAALEAVRSEAQGDHGGSIHAGLVPHRDHEARKASANSDMFQEAVARATRDDFEFDLEHAGAAILVGQASDPACRHNRSVASAWVGSDGAALLSIATFTSSWTTIIEEGALGLSAGTPPRVRHEAPADQPPVAAGSGGSLARDDRSGPVEDVSTSDGCEVRRRGWDRQAECRRSERALRKRSLAFCRYARGRGWSTEETAAALGLSPRTLWHWDHGWETDRLAPRPRGRPPQIVPVERQAEVTGFLELHGPSISLSSLQAEYPDVARAELAGLKAEYRAEWRQEHAEQRCRLEWLCGGSVWAMDFTHPPYLIDGVFPAILNVRDLASRHQLLWLAVAHEDAATVAEALADLFAEHGPPLVMKCDNGPAFRAHLTKRFLLGRDVFTLYSPPYCAQYNGGCERANRTLKELTAHVADQAGRRDFWTSDDLLLARLRANRLSRPWGPTGPTPEETWEARAVLSLDKRKNMWQHLRSEIATVLNQRTIDPTAALSHYPQAEIERIAAQPVLEQLGLLHVTRRRITPAF